MLGRSMRQPFSSLYFGLQLDPIQFLDISIGGRVYSATELAGAKPGDSAPLDSSGKPFPPITATNEKVAWFVSISASTDLFSTWLKALAKNQPTTTPLGLPSLVFRRKVRSSLHPIRNAE
jgi:hypothetical protein